MRDSSIKNTRNSKRINLTALPDTYEEFKQFVANGYLTGDILIENTGYNTMGTPYSKATTVPDNVVQDFNVTTDDPTIADVFNKCVKVLRVSDSVSVAANGTVTVNLYNKPNMVADSRIVGVIAETTYASNVQNLIINPVSASSGRILLIKNVGSVTVNCTVYTTIFYV